MTIELTEQERRAVSDAAMSQGLHEVVADIITARLAQERESGGRMHKAILDQVVLAAKTAQAEAWDEGYAVNRPRPDTNPTLNPYRDQP